MRPLPKASVVAELLKMSGGGIYSSGQRGESSGFVRIGHVLRFNPSSRAQRSLREVRWSHY